MLAERDVVYRLPFHLMEGFMGSWWKGFCKLVYESVDFVMEFPCIKLCWVSNPPPPPPSSPLSGILPVDPKQGGGVALESVLSPSVEIIFVREKNEQYLQVKHLRASLTRDD